MTARIRRRLTGTGQTRQEGGGGEGHEPTRNSRDCLLSGTGGTPARLNTGEPSTSGAYGWSPRSTGGRRRRPPLNLPGAVDIVALSSFWGGADRETVQQDLQTKS